MFRPVTAPLPRRRLLRLAAGAAAAWALAPGPARAQALPLAKLPGRPARDFTLRNLDGHEVRLSDFRGRVVIVNFWATWCPPCRFEIPSMQRAWLRTRDDGIAMLAVHVGGEAEEVAVFAFDHGVEFPVLLDPDSTVIRQWPVLGLPTTIVVDPQGHMALRAIGGREWDAPDILAQIRSLGA
ncbi:MAG: TlpA family protein disulfide reductase [Hyphomicrobiales bacterium]|nr:TlpA family protein disulfide reductase [Hyphomicrobiales bacterium]